MCSGASFVHMWALMHLCLAVSYAELCASSVFCICCPLFTGCLCLRVWYLIYSSVHSRVSCPTRERRNLQFMAEARVFVEAGTPSEVNNAFISSPRRWWVSVWGMECVSQSQGSLSHTPQFNCSVLPGTLWGFRKIWLVWSQGENKLLKAITAT